MTPSRKRYKRFALGFLFASILYWPIGWLIYDGPLIRLLPGMFGAALVIGLMAARPNKEAERKREAGQSA